jgi:hypothetical protein
MQCPQDLPFLTLSSMCPRAPPPHRRLSLALAPAAWLWAVHFDPTTAESALLADEEARESAESAWLGAPAGGEAAGHASARVYAVDTATASVESSAAGSIVAPGAAAESEDGADQSNLTTVGYEGYAAFIAAARQRLAAERLRAVGGRAARPGGEKLSAYEQDRQYVQQLPFGQLVTTVLTLNFIVALESIVSACATLSIVGKGNRGGGRGGGLLAVRYTRCCCRVAATARVKTCFQGSLIWIWLTWHGARKERLKQPRTSASRPAFLPLLALPFVSQACYG